MKITKIKIINFRSIKYELIEFPKSWILALVWANNAWKSNILRAIDNLLWDTWFNQEKAELNDFYNKDKTNQIELKIWFDNNRTIEYKTTSKRADYKDEHWRSIKERAKPEWSTWSVKEDFPCTYLSANRWLEKNLWFRSYELMWKIAKKFNDKAQSRKVEIETKFSEVMSIFDQIEGFTDFKQDFINYFDEIQSDSPYKLKINFKAFSPLNYFKTLNILANDSSIDDQFNIDVDELGEWNKSLLLFALIRSYAKNFKQDACWILAIEEPEIYLHPQARRHLYSVFQDIVRDSNIQIIYTTHSPDFVDTKSFDSIWLVSKDPQEGTKVKIVTKEKLIQFCEATWVPQWTSTINNIWEFYSTTADFKLNEWFFAKKLLLVEWDTEEVCLPKLFSQSWINCDAKWFSIIQVHGKNQIPKYWRLFKSLWIDVYCLFDNDNQWNNNIKSNQNLVSTFDCSIDDILTNVDVMKVLNTTNQKLFVFEENFEKALEKDFLNYLWWDNAQWLTIFNWYTQGLEWLWLTNKWHRAKYIIKKIIENYPTYKCRFAEQILQEIWLIPLVQETIPPIVDEEELPF